jgi:hypothetical protein
LNLEIFQRGEVALDRSTKCFRLRLGIFNIELWPGALHQQVSIAAQVAFCAVELCPVASERSLRLGDLRFNRAGIERDQDVALLDKGAVGEMNADDLIVEPRLDRDTRHCGHGAERLDLYRSLLTGRRCDLDRDCTRASTPPGVLSRCLLAAKPLRR